MVAGLVLAPVLGQATEWVAGAGIAILLVLFPFLLWQQVRTTAWLARELGAIAREERAQREAAAGAP